MPRPPADRAHAQSLGAYLADLRSVRRMTLREVEEATEGNVSNAYLSQLEKGKIAKPSPHILHSLAAVYAVGYELLMEKAGYLTAARRDDSEQHGRVATFADDTLTDEEETELLRYLAFIRQRKDSG